MDILIQAGSTMQPAPAGQVTLFIDTENNYILSYIDSAGVIKIYNSGDTSCFEDCCSCDIAKMWMDAIACGLKSGKLDATEYGIIIDQGLSVSTIETTDVSTGTKTQTVNIGPRTISNVAVTSIVLSGTNAIAVAGTSQLAAAILPVNASDQSLIWVSSDPTKATVSQTGLVTGVATGSTTIYAYSQSTPAVFGTRVITVS